MFSRRDIPLYVAGLVHRTVYIGGNPVCAPPRQYCASLVVIVDLVIQYSAVAKDLELALFTHTQTPREALTHPWVEHCNAWPADQQQVQK